MKKNRIIIVCVTLILLILIIVIIFGLKALESSFEDVVQHQSLKITADDGRNFNLEIETTNIPDVEHFVTIYIDDNSSKVGTVVISGTDIPKEMFSYEIDGTTHYKYGDYLIIFDGNKYNLKNSEKEK